MAHSTEDQFNVQWDVLQASDNALLDPLNDNSHEPAVLDSHNYLAESFHEDIDISDKVSGFSNDASQHESMTSSTSSLQSEIQVVVTAPRKETEGQGSFISYLVESHNKKSRRRFQDFVWLHNVLYTHFPACFVPPLPDKHRLEYVKGDRFSSDFIEKRRISLERFVQRIARHPILGKADFFIMFLQSPDFNDASARALREGQETVIDTIGDSLLNAFSKIRKPDQKFIDMKEHNHLMQDNLDMLQKTLARTLKRSEDLCHDYEDFTKSVRGLADIEPSYKSDLTSFAQGLERYTQNLKGIHAHDDEWLIEVQDYMAYYHAVTDVLKLRDQKQLDFEELSDYLQATTQDREKIDSGVASYITAKLNEIRGADPDRIKREKSVKLEERTRELKEAIDQTLQISTAFSDQVKKEDTLFNKNKAIEMHDVLKSYTEAKVNFYQDC
ncbi:hypothetical protein INT47_002977 [Mucor saturninus]|uniref:Sorting nexin-4 n=1 Tax=Mucor saturninus TaxID=64648 RepID=A0A8H7QTF4_9FUNG|nr:hypothetical protein INT47_002977 [Mucor saturninus]